MKNEQNELEQSHLDEVSSQEQVAAASSRRRLLRAGLKTAPIVVATLASRPSLACHCIVPSAWGSIKAADHIKFDQDIQNGTLSGSLARHGAKIQRDFRPYKFVDFSISSGSGWTDLRTLVAGKFPKRIIGKSHEVELTPDEKLRYLQGTFWNDSQKVPRLTVADLCSWLSIKVPAGSEASFPLAMIKGTSDQDRFGGAMFIALLNDKKQLLPQVCVDSTTNGNILQKMVKGSYAPEGGSVVWGPREIADYLDYNWFAKR